MTTMKAIPTCVLLVLAAAAATGSSAHAQRPGSIYDPSRGPFGPIADKTAQRAGDLLTVIISENLDLKNEETSNLTKGTSLDYKIASFDLKPSLFDPLPNITASSQDDFTGTATYEKKGEFTARLTAIVVDVLPNGNLVISGRRELRIDQEIKLIEFSGIVRRFDVKADNTVQSEFVAEARVSYTGTGPLTESTNRYGVGGFIHSMISWIWPF